MNLLHHPISALLIRAVLVVYLWQMLLITAGLVRCETQRPGTCDAQWAEARGAAGSIPATLLAWLTDSPLPKP